MLQDGRVFKAIERAEVEREARALIEGGATNPLMSLLRLPPNTTGMSAKTESPAIEGRLPRQSMSAPPRRYGRGGGNARDVLVSVGNSYIGARMRTCFDTLADKTGRGYRRWLAEIFSTKSNGGVGEPLTGRGATRANGWLSGPASRVVGAASV